MGSRRAAALYEDFARQTPSRRQAGFLSGGSGPPVLVHGKRPQPGQVVNEDAVSSMR